MQRQGNFWRNADEDDDYEISTRRWLRLSFERLLFTDRGRFAALMSVLIATYTNTSSMLGTTPAGEGLQPFTLWGFQITQQMLESATTAVAGGFLLVAVFLLGVVGLMAIDGYEYFIGTELDEDE